MDENVTEHRWSGWPGAWCLDCGQADLAEPCIANHPDGCTLPECAPGPCRDAGSGRHDPYMAKRLSDWAWLTR